MITGVNGMFATDLFQVSDQLGYNVVGFSHDQLDITQSDQVVAAIEFEKPDVVVNTPGIGVDICETSPDNGFKLHSWGAANVARACRKAKSVCVYISTCGLFGDDHKYYSEYDQVELKTQYAKSKYWGEKLTLEHCEKTHIIRPGWLFGGRPDHARNFVFQRYLEALDKNILSSASDKFGCPTYTKDLAFKLLELVESEQYGLYHLTNSGGASRFEYVKHIIDSFKLSTTVKAVDSSGFPRSAPVPDCELLDNVNVKFLGLDPMPQWDDAIQRYVDLIKKTYIT